MYDWIEIARHPKGFVLSKRYGLKHPWVNLRITHPDWVGRPKKDRAVFMIWNRARQTYEGAAIRRETFNEIRELYEWVMATARADLPRPHQPRVYYR
jgi:hypothetical protein